MTIYLFLRKSRNTHNTRFSVQTFVFFLRSKNSKCTTALEVIRIFLGANQVMRASSLFNHRVFRFLMTNSIYFLSAVTMGCYSLPYTGECACGRGMKESKQKTTCHLSFHPASPGTDIRTQLHTTNYWVQGETFRSTDLMTKYSALFRK